MFLCRLGAGVGVLSRGRCGFRVLFRKSVRGCFSLALKCVAVVCCILRVVFFEGAMGCGCLGTLRCVLWLCYGLWSVGYSAWCSLVMLGKEKGHPYFLCG